MFSLCYFGSGRQSTVTVRSAKNNSDDINENNNANNRNNSDTSNSNSNSLTHSRS